MIVGECLPRPAMPHDRGSDTSHDRSNDPAAKPHAPADTVVQHGFPAVARDPTAPAPPGYELLAEVGRGGMGVVYRARDLALGRDVAVKILQDRYPADGPFARQFLEEAQITSQLQHPGVPPIHLVGTLPGGRPFLVMKLIKGHTLDVLLAEKAELGQLLSIFENLCGTVGYAHDRGVIHRDLKPSNVMVSAFGEVQVMDWGLAKFQNAQHGETIVGGELAGTEPLTADPAPDATRTGGAKGTPAYMPPEQARGEWDRVDERADVFALGGVLCVLLTGRPPYTGSGAADILQKAKAAALGSALDALGASGADAELVALARRCLSAEPAARPADGKAMADAMAAYRAGVEERAQGRGRSRCCGC
jgi:serine/threonine protein kinase